MDVKKAFEILGLNESASEVEIEAAFRRLASLHHPDKGGAIEEMQRLNEAREVASSSFRTSAMVPVDAVREIVIATTNALVTRSEASRATVVATASAKERATSKLRRSKQMATLIGGMSGAALFLGRDLPDAFLGAMAGPEMSAMISFFSLAVGMAAALIYWRISTQIEEVERDIEEFSAHLSNRQNYVSFIGKITQDADTWSHEELERSLHVAASAKAFNRRGWYRLTFEVGPEVVAQLLIAKGVELSLLERHEKIDGRRLIERYSLALESSP